MFSQQVFLACGYLVYILETEKEMFCYLKKNTFNFLNYESVFHSLLHWECDSASELMIKPKL